MHRACNRSFSCVNMFVFIYVYDFQLSVFMGFLSVPSLGFFFFYLFCSIPMRYFLLYYIIDLDGGWEGTGSRGRGNYSQDIL